jgi:glycosyltransferase involved in cell wall biosynthesis
VPDDQLRDLYARCRALIMPGDEDFGIVPVEALASGKAVIALGRGGVLETVPLHDPVGGVLYDRPEAAALDRALLEFEQLEPSIQPAALQEWSQQFSSQHFQDSMRAVLALPSVG